MVSKLAELRSAVIYLRVDMKAMEEGLRKIPFPEPVLIMKQGSASAYWGEVCKLYKGLRGLTQHEKAKVEFI